MVWIAFLLNCSISPNKTTKSTKKISGAAHKSSTGEETSPTLPLSKEEIKGLASQANEGRLEKILELQEAPVDPESTKEFSPESIKGLIEGNNLESFKSAIKDRAILEHIFSNSDGRNFDKGLNNLAHTVANSTSKKKREFFLAIMERDGKSFTHQIRTANSEGYFPIDLALMYPDDEDLVSILHLFKGRVDIGVGISKVSFTNTSRLFIHRPSVLMSLGTMISGESARELFNSNGEDGMTIFDVIAESREVNESILPFVDKYMRKEIARKKVIEFFEGIRRRK